MSAAAVHHVPVEGSPPGADAFAAPAVAGAAAVLAAGIVTLALVEPGPLSLLMAQHLLLMNVVAPLAAVFVARRRRVAAPRGAVCLAGVAQMVLLWAWHAPPLQRLGAASAVPHVLGAAALFASALLFWTALLASGRDRRWTAVAALLLSAKVACLLGALLIFAPRELFALPGFDLVFCRTGPSTLADQQLAGLLMVTACPLSYVTAGIVFACRALADLETDPARAAGPHALA